MVSTSWKKPQYLIFNSSKTSSLTLPISRFHSFISCNWYVNLYICDISLFFLKWVFFLDIMDIKLQKQWHQLNWTTKTTDHVISTSAQYITCIYNKIYSSGNLTTWDHCKFSFYDTLHTCQLSRFSWDSPDLTSSKI